MLSKLQQIDMDYIFHPCSQMKDYEKLPPIVIKKAEGIYLEDEFGKKYMDCVSSWWVNLFGHCNKRINSAIKEQIDKVEHVLFVNFSHEAAIELVQELIKVVPAGIEKFLFADNGSSSIEMALKLSFQYHQQSGKPEKKRFISLKNAYHGETVGALGVGDIDIFTNTYRDLIKEGLKADGPDCYRCPYGKNFDNCSAQCFEKMEKLIRDNHKEISAVIIEPMVQGAAGMKMYSPEYIKKLRKLTHEYDIHLIADEIAMGFGRTGKMFAMEHSGTSPDIMCMSKGLTAGYYPMAIVGITQKIYDAFYADYMEGKSFLHSHSYSGNPIGCRIALEVLRIFRDENILKLIEEKGKYLNKRAKEVFKGKEYIGEFRQLGMIGAIELVQNNKKEDFPAGERAGYEIYKIALKKGALLCPLGNTIYFMPPYIITYDEIDKMLEICRDSIEEYMKSR
ncbi:MULTISPECIES: adenosylmethionine--8-amino-7-oxononanoate transaminase [unclassified Fusobacterium]|uniref:adenosylmethionine--8-amino-7-oxononanoate transaminase n=1 Tax=unclassified Fusobacterium TaxID=2648384 RepID=UPI001B8CCA48|nr:MULTISPECIES: adenosylmethionine--8-amino-7-oxononanoate transaminase [unclassified Fusobacterium]MBR8701783.1 Adenosylmethionine-8-amino-7-oxononanoate aminotransferase [Fusobacterium sp. DD45]MBR8711564.1 Adenosylmethionine-8-amino-7-oxononanoate aminotransferase [Fusobacterium sp. DD28]MBR8752113.1 Adenosylmethionine-8-amino-7-oxononanoate aminotransferase [Fusobacterium sp. DD26]